VASTVAPASKLDAHPGHAAGLPDTRAIFFDDPTDSHKWRRGLRDRGESPERVLALAVMTQALLDLRKFAPRACHGYKPNVYDQARAYFESNDRRWPLGFVTICEMFDWSPEAVRARILATYPDSRLLPRRQRH